MIAFTDFFSALRNGASKFRLLILAGLMLIPVVIAAPFTSVQKDAATHLNRIHAAIVNLDEPAIVKGQPTPVGRLLAASLIGDKTKRNITWQLATPDTARKGLADGTFSTVVWIPPTFSRDATSWSDVAHPEKAVRAMLNVQTSPSSGATDPIIGSYIASAAVQAVGGFLTTQFLQNVFVGFNSLHNQLVTAADGAGKLADGAAKLDDGLGQAAGGAAKLADGLHQLSNGANQLDAGTGLLANGAGKLAWGMGLLSDGLNLMSNKTDGVPQQLYMLADGSKKLADGLKSASAKVDKYYATYVPELDTINSTWASTHQIQQVADSMSATADRINSAVNACNAQLGAAASLCTSMLAAQQSYTGVNTPQVSNTLKAVSTLVAASPKSVGQGLSDAAALRDGLRTAAKGAALLAAGNIELASKFAQLKSGIDQAADGGNMLKVGADQLAFGTNKLHDGAHQLAHYMYMAADGSDQLAAGLKLLKAGAAMLADGNKKLHDGMVDGLKQMPTFTPDQIAKLSDLIAHPVASNVDLYSLGAGLGTGYFSALALAIAAVVLFMVLRAMPPRSLSSSDNALVLALHAFRPAAVICLVQAALLASVIGVVLHLGFGRSVEFMLVAMVAAISFASVSQGLVALFGGRGRFAALVALTLCAPGLVISTVPGILHWFVSITPVGPASDGMRSVLAGTGGMPLALVILAIWYLVGLGMTVYAIARHRSLAPARFFRPALASA